MIELVDCAELVDCIELDHATPTPNVALQIGLFALSLLDDAALIGLSRLGINIPGLELLGTIICFAVAAHWLSKLGEYLIQREEQNFTRFTPS
jgi:hypothetical protein